MFTAAFLVYSNAISVGARKYGAATAMVGGFTGLVHLIVKVETIVEAVRFFCEMGLSIFHAL